VKNKHLGEEGEGMGMPMGNSVEEGDPMQRDFKQT
jgi:hypothetical protein